MVFQDSQGNISMSGLVVLAASFCEIVNNNRMTDRETNATETLPPNLPSGWVISSTVIFLLLVSSVHSANNGDYIMSRTQRKLG